MLTDPLHRLTSRLFLSVLWLTLLIVPPLLLLGHWDVWSHASVLARWPFVERHDIRCYFDATTPFERGAGIFVGLRNEYPLLMNLVFLAVRAASESAHALGEPFERFLWTWIALHWVVYCVVLAVLLRHGRGIAVWLWLTPVALQFTLMRFDALPMLATFAALIALRRDRITQASLWWGLAIGLKTYGIVLLPCYAVYVLARHSWWRAALECALVLVPLALAHAIVFASAGRAAMLEPYRLLATHHLNGESVWDAAGYLLHADPHVWFVRVRALGTLCVLAASVLPALTWPKDFDAFIEAALLALLGSILLLDFQSPQYVLWALPLAALSPRRSEQWWFLLHLWATYLYFPVLFARRLHQPQLFRASVITAHATRVLVMLEVARGMWQRRTLRAAAIPVAAKPD